MSDNFWMMRPATMGIIANAAAAARRDALWLRLLGPMCEVVRPGKTLDGIERGWLEEWLMDTGRIGVDPDVVQVAQVPISWAADVLGLDDKAATRAVNSLVDIGLLAVVRKGMRGHPTLFAVSPLPESA